MKKNMGRTDRIIRIGMVILVAVLYFTNVISGTLAIVLGIFASLWLITSLAGVCPTYALFGIRTCKECE